MMSELHIHIKDKTQMFVGVTEFFLQCGMGSSNHTYQIWQRDNICLTKVHLFIYSILEKKKKKLLNSKYFVCFFYSLVVNTKL